MPRLRKCKTHTRLMINGPYHGEKCILSSPGTGTLTFTAMDRDGHFRRGRYRPKIGHAKTLFWEDVR